jgi:hypothetical protein
MLQGLQVDIIVLSIMIPMGISPSWHIIYRFEEWIWRCDRMVDWSLNSEEDMHWIVMPKRDGFTALAKIERITRHRRATSTLISYAENLLVAAFTSNAMVICI